MTITDGHQDDLDDLAAIGPYFAVETHPPGSGPTAPWRPLRGLAAADGRVYADPVGHPFCLSTYQALQE